MSILHSDTISALATPAGGAIAVIRVSGEQSLPVIQRIFSGDLSEPRAARSTMGRSRQTTGRRSMRSLSPSIVPRTATPVRTVLRSPVMAHGISSSASSCCSRPMAHVRRSQASIPSARSSTARWISRRRRRWRTSSPPPMRHSTGSP